MSRPIDGTQPAFRIPTNRRSSAHFFGVSGTSQISAGSALAPASALAVAGAANGIGPVEEKTGSGLSTAAALLALAA